MLKPFTAYYQAIEMTMLFTTNGSGLYDHCSHLAMRGAAAKAIQDLAGHQTIAVTNRYMHPAPFALPSTSWSRWKSA